MTGGAALPRAPRQACRYPLDPSRSPTATLRARLTSVAICYVSTDAAALRLATSMLPQTDSRILVEHRAAFTGRNSSPTGECAEASRGSRPMLIISA